MLPGKGGLLGTAEHSLRCKRKQIPVISAHIQPFCRVTAGKKDGHAGMNELYFGGSGTGQHGKHRRILFKAIEAGQIYEALRFGEYAVFYAAQASAGSRGILFLK